jgi:hypothetical protein
MPKKQPTLAVVTQKMYFWDMIKAGNLFWLTSFFYLIIISAPLHTLSQSPEVKTGVGDLLAFPWAGGLDACQFGEIDLNDNGFTDLVVFDRRGNRLLCFLNQGIPGEISYTYAPEYENYFPKISEWFVMADYDGDGKPDIFTYSPGWAGMQVYKNNGTDRPSFQRVVFPYLTSFQGGGYVNIISTNADYPVIADLDGDGDLDILTFWALGTFLELHTNQSIEKYGHADSLDFVKTDFCWGRIAEHEENNLIFLDTCLFPQAIHNKLQTDRHRGASMLAFDSNGNGLFDLLLGDVDFPNLNLLINGGSSDQALITEQNQQFPSPTNLVHLFSMPQPALIDVNNDGLKDLIVSPFDPSPIVSENKNSVWLYLNEGTNNLPQFVLHTRSFLQEEMIDFGSGAYPLFADLDQDGLNDLLVGNYGYYTRSWYEGSILKSAFTGKLTWLRNTGTNHLPVYEHTDEDLGGLSALEIKGLTPAAADLNGDGLTDLLVGNENGRLIYLQQVAPGNWSIMTTYFQEIDVGEYSAPQLFDLDGDGITDLIIGSRNGRISYYKGYKTGDETHFEYVTDQLGGVDVTDYSISYDGYSTPHFFHTPMGELLLVCGSEQGKLFLFEQITGNLSGTFQESDRLENLIDTVFSVHGTGIRTAAAIQPGPENTSIMIAGNYSGGLNLYNSKATVVPGLTENITLTMLRCSPVPAAGTLTVEWVSAALEPILIEVFDMQGKPIHRQQIKAAAKQTINVEHWPKGVYFLVAHNAQSRLTTKIVIAR